ncbi:MAG: glycosyltransferase family 39 protein, partial [Chloroflexi bacterium]|nr:glycosyltransferase family 39 protein [Chloroflexota bacterium]
MQRVLALVIALLLAAWGQSFAPKRDFPWDALILYGASALIFVFAVLPGLPHGAQGPSPLLPRLRRRGWLLIVLGIVLSGAAAVPFLRKDYSTLPMAMWLLGLALIVAGGYLLWPRTAGQARPGRPWWEVWGLCFILLVAVFVRVYQLTAIPNGLYLDEADNDLEALRLFTLPTFIPFTPVSNGHPTLFLYLLGLAFKAIGPSPFTMRVVVAVVGVLTVAAFYPLARQLFARWLALALTFLLAVSHWHVTFSRIGFEGILTPLAAVLTFYWLLRGLRTRRPLDFVLAGLSLGAGMYTYLPFRAIPGAVIALLAAMVLFDPARWRGRVAGAGLMVVTSLLVFAPLAAHFWDQPNDFYNRASQASVTLDMQRQHSNQNEV